MRATSTHAEPARLAAEYQQIACYQPNFQDRLVAFELLARNTIDQGVAFQIRKYGGDVG
jgi:hypothetical protein